MKKIFFIVFVILAGACSPRTAEDATGLLAPGDFDVKLKSDSSIVLIDVRTAEEMQSGFIAGAENMDFNSPDFHSALSSMNQSKTYFVYCAVGKRSGKAAGMMKEMGFQHVITLDGGLKAWKAAGLPVQAP